MIGPQSWVSVVSQDRIRLLNQRGWIVAEDGSLTIRGVTLYLRVRLPGHDLIVVDVKGEIVPWKVLIPHLTPQPAPRQRRHPDQVLAEHMPAPTTLMGQRLQAAMSR